MTKLHVLRPGIPTGPLTRGECREWERVCRLRSCRYNLGHESLTEAHGGGKPATRPRPVDGCALDVADCGPSSIEAVASALGVSRSRAGQIEDAAMRKLARLQMAQRAYAESDGQADRAGASLPGGMEDE